MRAGVVFDDLGAGDGPLPRDVALAADALAVRRVGGVESESARSRLNLLSRARTSRFLRKSARTLRFFFDMSRERGAAEHASKDETRQLPAPCSLLLARLHRLVRQLDLARPSCSSGRTACRRRGVRVAFEFAVIQPGPRQQRLAHDLLREIVGRRRADGAQLGRVVFHAVLVLGDRRGCRPGRAAAAPARARR